jgi:hypothetical protein
VADRDDTLSEETHAAEPKPRRRKLLLWGSVGLLVLVVFLLVWPVFSTLQPSYYRRYLKLDDRMNHWENSTHSKVTCTQCHVEPGIKGYASFAVRSIPAFYSQLVGGASDTNLLSAPSRAACQKCHTTYRTVAPSGDLLIPHRAHVVVLKMECVECHKDLVHSENRRGFNRPEMETCVEKCHDGDTASNECADCHTSKSAPKSHEGKDWLKTHGASADTVDCAKCHSWTPDYCAECHSKRPASHTKTWKTDHAGPAKQRGDGCLVCHDRKFCEECH